MTSSRAIVHALPPMPDKPAVARPAAPNAVRADHQPAPAGSPAPEHPDTHEHDHTEPALESRPDRLLHVRLLDADQSRFVIVGAHPACPCGPLPAHGPDAWAGSGILETCKPADTLSLAYAPPWTRTTPRPAVPGRQLSWPPMQPSLRCWPNAPRSYPRYRLTGRDSSTCASARRCADCDHGSVGPAEVPVGIASHEFRHAANV
jgi:hypothetical protein